MIKYLFIGSLQWGLKSTGGGVQTKNQHFLRYVLAHYKDCFFYDTYNKNPLVTLIYSLFYILKISHNSVIFLSIAYRGAYAIGKIIRILKLRRRIFYLVPGGNFADFAKQDIGNKKNVFSKFEKILVQAKYIKNEMDDLGYSNIEVLPNFKPLIFVPKENKEYSNNFKFVYLSRIKKDKGVDEIIEALKMLNRKDLYVDFYGEIFEPYDEVYFDELKEYNVQYKGFLDLSEECGYHTLSSYDAFLFPTYFEGEGFPGALIDSFIAGVPAIATDFHANGEIISDGVNGLLIPIKDAETLALAMTRLANDRSYLNTLRDGAIRSAVRYDINSVLDKLFYQIGEQNNG